MVAPKNIEVIPATPDQQPLLANLLELYVHDFSEFHPVELGPDGRFGFPSLPLYWSEPHRYPFLLRANGNLAGFAFVKRGSEISCAQNVWDMAEFFVIRRYRRDGIGTAAAHKVWRRFPGRWEIRVLDSNHSALGFWGHAISQFTGSPIPPVGVEKAGKRWQVFSLEAKP